MTQDELALAVMDDDGFGCAITTSPVKPAAELKEGDRIRTHGTVVKVLHDAKHTTEVVAPLAGRPCITVWGEREDTGARGNITFGPAAEVLRVVA